MIVENPEIRPINRPLDFGVGFYVTSIRKHGDFMAESRVIAKRLMETRIIAKLSESKNISEKEAMSLFYNSSTYKWFADDNIGIAREGADAILCRVLNELDGDLS